MLSNLNKGFVMYNFWKWKKNIYNLIGYKNKCDEIVVIRFGNLINERLWNYF